MPLSDTALRNAKAREKAYKLSDTEGLYALIQTSGSRLWRMDYRFNGKRKTLALGRYPVVSLSDARDKRDAAKRQIEKGVDPSLQKKLDRLTHADAEKNTFGVVAAEFLDRIKEEGGIGGQPAAATTVEKKRWLLEDLAKDMTDRPIAQITPAEVLDVLRKVEHSGRRETAIRLRSAISRVFRLAVATLRADNDPTWPLRGALKAPVVENFSAITDERELGALMCSIDVYDGWPSLRCALLFTALTVARPGEVRGAQWTEFDLAQRKWTIPAQRTKTRKKDREIPLCRQAVAVLNNLKPFSGRCALVFPSIRNDERPLSENAMNSALRRMGYAADEHTSHGFRSSFSTIMNERGHDAELIESALGHQDGSVRGIYNRARYWQLRAELMQTWADLLDEFREGGKRRQVEDFADLLG